VQQAIAIPDTIEGLTASWLTQAIGQRCPGLTVTSATVDRVIWGTSTKVLMPIEYTGPRDCELPQRLCVKGEFDERVRNSLTTVTMTGTQVEAQFYNDVAPRLGIPMPRHWFGGSKPGMGVLILDDLAALGATFGDPVRPWPPERVARALEILAALHASTWDRRFEGIAWLGIGSPTLRQYSEFLMSEAHWQTHFTQPDAFKLPRALSDRQQALNALRAMWRYDDQHAHCLVHGDAHLGNTCVAAGGQPFFIDWAGPSISHWALDVSYFIAGSLTVADRRSHERDLLQHYGRQLRERGGPQLQEGAVWDDYRRHQLHGMCWSTLPSTLQSPENVDAMAERYTCAMLDHDSIQLLAQVR